MFSLISVLIFTLIGVKAVAVSKGIHGIGGEICPCQFKLLTRKKNTVYSASENDTEKTECVSQHLRKLLSTGGSLLIKS